MDLGIGVDGVVSNVKELRDFGLWELLNDAFTTLLILDQLAGYLLMVRRAGLCLLSSLSL